MTNEHTKRRHMTVLARELGVDALKYRTGATPNCVFLDIWLPSGYVLYISQSIGCDPALFILNILTSRLQFCPRLLDECDATGAGHAYVTIDRLSHYITKIGVLDCG